MGTDRALEGTSVVLHSIFQCSKLNTFQKFYEKSMVAVALNLYISSFDGFGSVCSSRLGAFSTLRTTTSQAQTAGWVLWKTAIDQDFLDISTLLQQYHHFNSSWSR